MAIGDLVSEPESSFAGKIWGRQTVIANRERSSQYHKYGTVSKLADLSRKQRLVMGLAKSPWLRDYSLPTTFCLNTQIETHTLKNKRTHWWGFYCGFQSFASLVNISNNYAISCYCFMYLLTPPPSDNMYGLSMHTLSFRWKYYALPIS